MSRSYKKPFGTIAKTQVGEMKKWKKESNRSCRRKDDLYDGSFYKKINDIWNSPSDGKTYSGNENPKYKRK